jgi:galactose mutarotase-like enzyme
MVAIIKNEHITASINSFGAELMSLTKNNKNYIWTINEQYWNKTSPILFPIVGRLKNDSYLLNNQKYSMSRHGFARNFDFKVIAKTEDSVCFSLQESPESLQQYPFQFELQICYTLIQNQLTISYFVQNNSETKMPFSIGAHPAFAISTDFENYDLQFDNDTFLLDHKLENDQFSGKTETINLENKILNLNYSLFESDALVFKEFKSKHVTILENNKPYLKVNLGDFPNLGIWTKNNASFLCLEPWFGYADNANTNANIFDKAGIQILETNKTFETSFSIEIL